jgi:hypothetical protein
MISTFWIIKSTVRIEEDLLSVPITIWEANGNRARESQVRALIARGPLAVVVPSSRQVNGPQNGYGSPGN